MYFGVLAGAGVKIDLSGYKLEESGKGYWVWRTDNSKVYIEKVSVVSNEKLVSDRKLLLESLYETAASPYADRVSSKIVCGEKYVPIKTKLDKGEYYTLWAGERYNFGVCSDDLVKYRAGYGVFDCGKKGVFEIRYFGNKETGDPNKLLESFNCK